MGLHFLRRVFARLGCHRIILARYVCPGRIVAGTGSMATYGARVSCPRYASALGRCLTPELLNELRGSIASLCLPVLAVIQKYDHVDISEFQFAYAWCLQTSPSSLITEA